jgi:hypothetical protein
MCTHLMQDLRAPVRHRAAIMANTEVDIERVLWTETEATDLWALLKPVRCVDMPLAVDFMRFVTELHRRH